MNPYCLLAKKTIETYIRDGLTIDLPDDLPAEFYQKKAGVFVGLHKGDFLRGCIGTYLPTQENIGQEIMANAITATRDPRFASLQPEELKYLSYEVYILEPPEPIRSPAQLDPKQFGLIVKSLSSAKSALLLPDLEGIKTAKEQLAICCQKAGIDTKKEAVALYRFRAKKYTG